MNNISYFNIIFGEEEFDDGYGENLKEVDRIIMIGVYVFICLFLLVGNLFIIYFVCICNNIWKNVFNWFFFNMVVVDFLDVIIFIVFMLLFFFCGECWILGVVGFILCKFIFFLFVVFICVFIWIFIVIVVDWYLVIVCIWRRLLLFWLVVCFIVIVWLFVSLIFSGEFYKYKLIEEEGEFVECIIEWYEDKEFV